MKSDVKTRLPKNCGTNHFSEYIETARKYLDQSVTQLKPEYERLSSIDAVFKTIEEHLDYSREWVSAFFLLRCHSSFLCGSSVGLSGQLPEAYMVLRGCLENSLYGLWFWQNKEDAKIWFRRNESEAAKKIVRDKFKIATLLGRLKTLDSEENHIAKSLYDRTVDFGAHPNPLALTTAMKWSKLEDGTYIEIAYISGNDLANKFCLKTAAEVGICTLSIFGNVYKKKYELFGINERIEELKRQ